MREFNELRLKVIGWLCLAMQLLSITSVIVPSVVMAVTEESQVASQATLVANLLAADDASAAAIGLPKGEAGNLVNSTAQNWLGQYGTAQVQLGFGDGFSLEERDVDWLLPLYDNDESLFYIPTGAINKDDRDTFNVGVGTRQYVNGWLYGANIFYDVSWNGNNR